MGGDAANPVPRQELVGKFTFLTEEALGREGAAGVVAAVDALEEMEDVKELTDLLRPAP